MFCFKSALALALALTAGIALADNQNVKWIANLVNAQPIDSSTSQLYCSTHTPNKVVAAINQLTAQPGVKALNGINLYYSSYKVVSYDNLYFLFANAVASGQDKNGSYSYKLKIYAQALTQDGVFKGVWSSSNCKGYFNTSPAVPIAVSS